jgi:hypothetical protein
MIKGRDNFQRYDQMERNMKRRRSIKTLKHTSRGSKLINLYVVFGCALHILLA